jgi:hypothetical protein
MRHYWALTYLVCSLLAATATAKDADKPTGIDLFIEACHSQGLNPAMIRTGYAELEVTTTKLELSEANLQKQVDAAAKSYREAMKKMPDEKSHAQIEQTIKNLPNVIRINNAERRSRVKMLFDGNDVELGRRRMEESFFEPVFTRKWTKPGIALRNGLSKSGEDSISWQPSQNMAVVSRDGSYSIEFQAFGRMQGLPSRLITVTLLSGTDMLRFEFLSENVAKVKAQYSAMAGEGNIKPFDLTGETKYDGNAVAYVVESRVKTSSGPCVVQRYWIDASRGYVCPLIQLYDNEGRLGEEWKSSDYFLHEKSGLWFPVHHIHTQYIPETGKLREQTTYLLDRNTLRINEDVSEKEFAVQLPIGATVLDAREANQPNYTVRGPVTLSLVKGGLDLETMPGLKPSRLSGMNTPRSRFGAGAWVTAALLAMIAVFLLRQIRKSRRAAELVCLLFCLACPFWQGCSHVESGESKAADPVVIEPKVVTFDSVNEADGPLNLSFTLTNYGNQPIEITGARSGCGCTVAKLSRSVVPPRGHIRVPIRVNIFGRLGKFENSVLVDVSGRTEPIRVPLEGTIVQDLWYSGQAIVCSTAGSATTVENTFEVCTVDWPSVQFDWKVLDKSIRIQELSRSKKAIGTVIQFRLVMDVPAVQHTVTNHIILKPLDDRVRPLTIPVVCYRTSPHNNRVSLRPERIGLGAIPCGDSRTFRVFGDAKLIDSLRGVGCDDIPEGMTVEVQPASIKGKGSLTLTLRVGEAVPAGLFNGRLRLRSTIDGHEYSIVVSGLVRPDNTGANDNAKTVGRNGLDKSSPQQVSNVL